MSHRAAHVHVDLGPQRTPPGSWRPRLSGPLATSTLNLYSPMIFAAMATHRGASEAQITHLMQPAHLYELGQMSDLVPVYVRGLGYLRAGAGGEASREFQEILDHRGVDCVSPVYSLSYLQLGRAYKLAGDKEKNRKSLPGVSRDMEGSRRRHSHPACGEAGVRSRSAVALFFGKSRKQ